MGQKIAWVHPKYRNVSEFEINSKKHQIFIIWFIEWKILFHMDTKGFTTSLKKAISTIRVSLFHYSVEADVEFLFLKKIEKQKMENIFFSISRIIQKMKICDATKKILLIKLYFVDKVSILNQWTQKKMEKENPMLTAWLICFLLLTATLNFWSQNEHNIFSTHISVF